MDESPVNRVDIAQVWIVLDEDHSIANRLQRLQAKASQASAINLK